MTDVTIWYDSQCPLCLREIALMRRLDRRRRIAFIAIESGIADPKRVCTEFLKTMEEFLAKHNPA